MTEAIGSGSEIGLINDLIISPTILDAVNKRNKILALKIGQICY
jgi:hypothetical protein